MTLFKVFLRRNNRIGNKEIKKHLIFIKFSIVEVFWYFLSPNNASTCDTKRILNNLEKIYFG
jgi:hypothetical protein